MIKPLRSILKIHLGLPIIIAYTVFILVPIYWIVITSFKETPEVYAQPPTFFPNKPTTMAYIWVLKGEKAIPSLLSSFTVVSISTALALFFGTMAGYSFSRFLRTGLGEKISFWVLTTRMFPPVIIAFPLYYLYTWFNLIDTYSGLILTYLVFNLPLSTWLMKTYFDDVPFSYEEAAYVNGYSVFRTFWKVTLPLVHSGLISAGILCWIFVWGEFLFAVVLTGTRFSTYPALIPTLSTGFNIQWNNIMALSTIAMTPPILFLFLLRKKLVSGLSLGAVRLR